MIHLAYAKTGVSLLFAVSLASSALAQDGPQAPASDADQPAADAARAGEPESEPTAPAGVDSVPPPAESQASGATALPPTAPAQGAPQVTPVMESAGVPPVTAAEPSDASTTDAEAEAEVSRILEEEPANSPIQFYGFADFNFRQTLMKKDSPWYLFGNRHRSFFVGNLNAYLDAQVATQWRLLAEVRFTYLPGGAAESDPATGSQSRVDSSYQDYTDFVGRDRQVGGTIIERAQLEFRAHDYLTLTVGQWLTPYGIWVVDHGSPVIIGVFRPFIIGSQLIPERQVGLLASGTIPLNADIDASYALGLSNGRMDYTAFEDMDNDKAVTARAAVNYRGLGDLTLGATFYRGQDTRGEERLYGALDGDETQTLSRFMVSSRLNEVSLAGDLRWSLGPVYLQTEWLLHEIHYTEDGRPQNAAGLYYPDRREWGGYGLLGYRLPWFGIMPFAKFERSPHPDALAMGIPSKYVIVGGGLNVRAISNVVMKVEYDYGFFTDEDAKTFSKSSQRYINAQIACSF